MVANHHHNVFSVEVEDMSALKVEFIDNSSSQYDENAARIRLNPLPSSSEDSKKQNTTKQGRLYVGDKDSLSFVQIKARSIKAVLCCNSDLAGFCREDKVDYMKIDAEHYSLPSSSSGGPSLSKKVREGNEQLVTNLTQFVDKHLRQGHHVLVCCESGYRSSILFTAAFLMKTYSYSLEDCLDQIEGARGKNKFTLSQCKIALDIEKKVLGKQSMKIDGKVLISLSSSGSSPAPVIDKTKPGPLDDKTPNPEGNRKNSNSVSGTTILLGVGLFFGVVFGVLYAVTGKV